MLKIALTGGIGSGKSVAAKYFAKFKIPILDADTIAHELLRPGTVTYQKIINHFGVTLLTPKKLINREKLRTVIFNKQRERIWLEKLLHPRVRTIMQNRAKLLKAPYGIMVIPLFFETKSPFKVDRVLAIDCPKKLQIKRAHQRDNLSIKQIQVMLKTQASRDLRLKNADDIIRNIGSLKQLAKAVKILHNYYLSISKKHGMIMPLYAV